MSEITQEQYVIEQLARENASLKIELAKANFQVLALSQKLQEDKEDK